jgi:hypothetical protein
MSTEFTGEEMKSLKERLNRLERTNRRIKTGFIIAIVCVIAAASMGAQQATRKIIDSDEFVMRDAKGQIRARLFSDALGPHFVLYDSTGEAAAFLQSDMLELVNAKRKQSIALSMAGNNLSMLMSGNGQEVGFLTDPDGASLTLNTKNDKEHVLLSIGGSGPAMELVDARGFETHVGSTETKTLRNGEKHQTSAASLIMFGQDGKVIWSAP